MLWTWSPAGGFGPVPCEALLGGGDWCLCSGGWSWILSLWRAVLHPVVCVGVSVNKVWHWDTPLLLSSVVFMFCWWFGIRRLALELSGLLCCMVLVLRWRPLGELLLFNIPWDWEFSHGATPWTQVSYLGDSGLTPSVAPRLHKPHSIQGKEKVIKGNKKGVREEGKNKRKEGKEWKKKEMKSKRKKKTSNIERKKKRTDKTHDKWWKQHKQQSTDKNKQRSFHTHKENRKKKKKEEK